MKKVKTSKQQAEREKAAREAILKEREFVKENVIKVYTSAEEIAVDSECKIVDFYVSNQEFNSKKSNFETDSLSFVLEKADKDMISLSYKYSVKK
jgi:NAD(P)H-nitrite reductase large subunit